MSAVKEEVDLRTKTALDEKGFVYMHITFFPTEESSAIRIWQTTFLCDRGSIHESRLVHAFNIPYAPEWLLLEPGRPHQFLLIFEGLPGSCSQFDMIERIPQEGGFEIRGIHRNKSDVYRQRLS